MNLEIGKTIFVGSFPFLKIFSNIVFLALC